MFYSSKPILALTGKSSRRADLLETRRYIYSALAGLLLYAFVLLPCSNASEFDKKTILTFNESVQIPGTVLEPGTYVVKRADPMANPDVVRFFNTDETRLYATVLAIPVERPAPMDSPSVSFAEIGGSSTQALRTWFYPGELTGAEFIYPKGSRVMMASTSGELATRPSSAPTVESAEPTASTPESQAVAETQATSEQPAPAQQPVEIAQATAPNSQSTSTPNSPASANQTQTSGNQQATQQLPQTASSLPLAALIGMLCVFGGWTLRKFSHHLS
jgi:hypothetical protein